MDKKSGDSFYKYVASKKSKNNRDQTPQQPANEFFHNEPVLSPIAGCSQNVGHENPVSQAAENPTVKVKKINNKKICNKLEQLLLQSERIQQLRENGLGEFFVPCMD